ncbi:MAG: XdhC family protein [Sulfitobacter sp.]
MGDPIAFAEHPSRIIAHALQLAGQTKWFALVTSVAIEGGAARELGSLAVVDEDGQMTGYLSNGCIDKDIQLHALDTLQSGAKKLLRYGDGSQYADLTLPCGGALSVLIDPDPDLDALTRLGMAFDARQVGTLTFTLPVNSQDAETIVRFEYKPQFRLVLAGRGAIFRAVAMVGHATGFEVACLSPDTDDLAAVQRLTQMPPVHLTSPSQDVSLETLDAHAAFLTLFHDHEWEPELLRAALKTPAHFIGSLGSRRTHAGRLDRLRHFGVSEAAIERLHGPIGLVPSLRDAPLIAVSSIAEIASTLPPSIRRLPQDVRANSQALESHPV